MKTIILSGLLLMAGLNTIAQTATNSVEADTAIVTIQEAEGKVYDNQPKEVYKIKGRVDIPLTIAATAFDLYGLKEIYSKPESSLQRIQRVKREDLNGFDRWATDVYHEKAAATSDILFYGAMPLPALLLLDKDIRKDGWKVMFLYFETMTITGIYYTGSALLVDRYRPYVYNPNAPIDQKTRGVARNSFLAGHPALVGTSTFFIAKVFSDYHPDSNLRPWLFGAAGLATGATAYLRHRAGRHFPTDLIAGTTLGTLTGILVPHFHKNKIIKDKDISIIPFSGQSHGVHLVFRF